MAWVHVMAGYQATFRERGLDSASTFLAWTGILVNRHRSRQVEQVNLHSTSTLSTAGCFYLKKQFKVSWSEHFRNAFDGFGWCSTAVREAKHVTALREVGIGCPEVVAQGEHNRQAFVLLKAELGMTELRVFVQQLSSEKERHRLAEALGRELAKLHDAGFEHPDLFAKHILVAADEKTFRFCLLDWQRGRRHNVVSWRLRCRDLALLDATLHGVLASDRLRLRCLTAYARATKTGAGSPPLQRIAKRIRHEASVLRQRRVIREIGHLPLPAAQQEFVSLRGGDLLVVRSYYEEMRGQIPAWLSQFPDVGSSDGNADFPGEGIRVHISPLPARSTLSWPLPTLAHDLFRLHRFGVPAPRLLAVARSSSHVLLVVSKQHAVSFQQSLAKATLRLRVSFLEQAGEIVRQVHEAGYSLGTALGEASRLGVNPANGEVVLADADALQNNSADWRQLAESDLPALLGLVSFADRLRFLRSYLRQRSWTNQQRRWIKTLLLQERRRWEGQVAS